MAGFSNGDAEGWFDWAYKGVDHSFPGNGGLECRDFLSVSQRCWESVVASMVALAALVYAFPRLRLPRPNPCVYRRKQEPMGKRLLLVLMCLTFGIELGFKLATRQMIWIGNPCHLATMMQIFILAAPPSRIVTAAFRLHMHMLTGAPIAILFPVINTRLLPFETSVYFLQHILMLVIPFYLMRTGDPFIPERLGDFSWAMVSFGFLFLYHFLPLQLLAYVSQVNLNNMLCPAVSDPFHGKFYRLFAICHQLILIPTLGKLFVVLARAFNILPCENLPDEAYITDVFLCESKYSCVTNTCCSSHVSQDSSPVQEPSDNLTDRDSGCVGSNSLSLTKRQSLDRSRRNPAQCCCCGDTLPAGCRCKSSRGCSCRLNTSCSNAENAIAVQRLVNGKLVVEADEEEEEACRPVANKKSSGQSIETRDDKSSCRSFQPRSFLLKDSTDSDHKGGLELPGKRSNLGSSKNGHAKTH